MGNYKKLSDMASACANNKQDFQSKKLHTS